MIKQSTLKKPLTVDNLHLSYGSNPILKGVSMTLNKHFGPEFFAFLRAHATSGKVSYVTASIAPLYEVRHRGIAGSQSIEKYGSTNLSLLGRFSQI